MPLLIQRTMLHSRYIRGQLSPGNLPNGRCLLLVVCRKSEKCSPHPKALRAWGRKSTHTGRRKSFPSVSCALIPSQRRLSWCSRCWVNNPSWREAGSIPPAPKSQQQPLFGCVSQSTSDWFAGDGSSLGFWTMGASPKAQGMQAPSSSAAASLPLAPRAKRVGLPASPPVRGS